MRVDYIRPARFPATPVPTTADKVPLAFVRAGTLYSVRPTAFGIRCPYCGRENPCHGRGIGHSADGFRWVGYRRHVFACYDKELLRHGLAEHHYVAAAESFVLWHVKKTTRPPRSTTVAPVA